VSQDDALSTTANVLLVLTFAYVVLLGTTYSFTTLFVMPINLTRLRLKADSVRQRLEAAKPLVAAAPSDIDPSRLRDLHFFLDWLDKQITNLESELVEVPDRADGSGERWYLVWHRFRAKRKKEVLRGKIIEIEFRFFDVDLYLLVA
jgi:hypothetical protein